MALPSLMQHRRVLENAELVTSEIHRRVRAVGLRPGALDVPHRRLGEHLPGEPGDRQRPDP